MIEMKGAQAKLLHVISNVIRGGGVKFMNGKCTSKYNRVIFRGTIYLQKNHFVQLFFFVTFCAKLISFHQNRANILKSLSILFQCLQRKYLIFHVEIC